MQCFPSMACDQLPPGVSVQCSECSGWIPRRRPRWHDCTAATRLAARIAQRQDDRRTDRQTDTLPWHRVSPPSSPSSQPCLSLPTHFPVPSPSRPPRPLISTCQTNQPYLTSPRLALPHPPSNLHRPAARTAPHPASMDTSPEDPGKRDPRRAPPRALDGSVSYQDKRSRWGYPGSRGTRGMG
jgi:hypothetical protein